MTHEEPNKIPWYSTKSVLAFGIWFMFIVFRLFPVYVFVRLFHYLRLYFLLCSDTYIFLYNTERCAILLSRSSGTMHEVERNYIKRYQSYYIHKCLQSFRVSTNISDTFTLKTRKENQRNSRYILAAMLTTREGDRYWARKCVCFVGILHLKCTQKWNAPFIPSTRK